MKSSFTSKIQHAYSPTSASIFIYETQGATLSFVIGSTHTESVGNILDIWHSLADGGSFIGPVISKLQTPPMSDVWITYASLPLIPRSVLDSLTNSDEIFAVLNLANNTLVMMAREKASLYIDIRSQSFNSLTRFAFGWSNTPISQKQASSRHYDPILAQISELIRQTLPALQERVKYLSDIWDQTFPFLEFYELKEVESAAVSWIDKLSSLSKQVKSEDELITIVDMVAQLAENDIQMCTSLAVGLSDYNDSDPMKEIESYVSGGSCITLKAIYNYATSLLSRFDLENKYRPLPFFGQQYSMYLKVFSLPQSFKQPLYSTIGLSIPRNHRLRLGAFPIIAHDLAHLRLQAHDGEMFVQKLALGHYNDFVNQAIHQTQSEIDDNFLKNRGRSYVQQMTRRAEEIAADLLACSIAGPAYIYAVLRFVSGTLREFGNAPSAYEDFPQFVDRISLCISHMRTTGFDINIESQFWEPRTVILSSELQTDILRLIARPYSISEHDHALQSIQPSLIRGEVIDIDSGEIINALWDAVVSRSGYVNEFSAMYSIQFPFDNSVN